jgi:DNA-binding NarL/FixJ family response regulator
MPRKSGLECLKEIRENKKYNNIPILMFSTSSHLKDVDEAYALGANLYIPKSEFFKDELQAVSSIFCPGWQRKLLMRDKNRFVLQGKIVFNWTKG